MSRGGFAGAGVQGWPVARAGMVIGLLGGSFDPAHEGHAHITREALKRFGLDRVWWLVSPGNPLKAVGPAPMALRIARAQRVMRHPRVIVSDVEARMGTRHTAATLRRLQARYPGVRFVWLMGADNMVQFHRWDNWRWILRHVPVGVLARPGAVVSGRQSRAAQVFAAARIPQTLAGTLGRRDAPAWCFVDVPLIAQSSSAIRARGGWPRRRVAKP